jgi:hypothetical protein
MTRTWQNTFYSELAQLAHTRGLEVRNVRDDVTRQWYWQILATDDENESLYDTLPETI